VCVCVAVCYNVLHYVAVCLEGVLQCVCKMCCSVLQCVRVVNSRTNRSLPISGVFVCFNGVLECVGVCCNVLQCGAVSCSVLQRVAVCCSVFLRRVVKFVLRCIVV